MLDIVTLNGYKIKDEKAVRSYETVALMKADTKLKEGYHVKTKGYYSINDGGSTEYYITSSQSESEYQEELENGLYATLIVENEVNILQGGAKPNDETFDSTLIINTLLSKFKKVIIPNGKFYVNNIRINSGNILKGNNRLYSILSTTSDNSTIISNDNTGTRNGVIENLTIDGNNQASYGLYLDYFTHSSIVRNVTISKCDVGCYIDRCWYGQFINMDISNNGRGLELNANNSEINSIQFINCYINYATTDYGIYIKPTNHIINSIEFNSCTIEHTENKGIFIDTESAEFVRNLKINNCYFEQNKDNCIDGIGRELTIENCYFHPLSTSQIIINSRFSSLFINNCFEEANVIPNYSIYHTGTYLFCNCYYFNASNKLYTTENCKVYVNSPQIPSNLYNMRLTKPGLYNPTNYNTATSNHILFGINESAVDNNAPFEYKIKYDYSNAYFGIPLKITQKCKTGNETDLLTISGRVNPKLKINDITTFEIPKGSTLDRPTTNISSGCMYFDTTLGKPIWYNGTNWVDASGTQV